MRRSNRKIFVTLLRYNVDNGENSYAQVQLFTTKKVDEKFQQIVLVKYKLEVFIYLLDVTDFVCDRVISNEPSFNVGLKVTLTILLFIIFLFFRVTIIWNNGDNRNLVQERKSKFGLPHVVLTTPKHFPKNVH